MGRTGMNVLGNTLAVLVARRFTDVPIEVPAYAVTAVK
jgi:hypothetical protein